MAVELVAAPSPAEVRALRERLGLSLTAFGALLHVKSIRVRQWEEGEQSIPADLCRAFWDLEPKPPVRTRPVAGDTVTLHQTGPVEWIAASGELATPIGGHRL